MLAPYADSANVGFRALWGALHHETAYTAARAGRTADAWRWWGQADEIAKALPVDFYEPMTSFSRVVMGAHAVTIAVESRKAGEAARQAARTVAAAIPSKPRRGRHLIEVARAWQLAGDRRSALGTLRDANEAAPETIRFNGYARRIVLETAQEPGALQADARDLADRIGLLV